jgi:UDP-N-acetylglucosamine 2-epimerase
VGDVMYEALLNNSQIAESRSTILKQLKLQPKEYFVVTAHRAENTDDGTRLQSILVALQELSAIHPVIWPVHPRTRKALERHHPSLQINQALHLIDPISYLDMLVLEKRSRVILTDSGGVQKEAYWFGVPCVTLRDETEWVETVGQGWNTLAGTDPDRIVAAVKSSAIPVSPRRLCDDGRAAERIVRVLAGFHEARMTAGAKAN